MKTVYKTESDKKNWTLYFTASAELDFPFECDAELDFQTLWSLNVTQNWTLIQI